MKSLLLKYNLLLFVAMLLLNACSAADDNDQDQDRAPQVLNNLSFNLSRALPETGSLPDENANPDKSEWMHDWHIVIVNDKGKIEVVMSRSGFTTTLTEPFESETVKTSESSYSTYFDGTVTAGTAKVYEGEKHIYVFANMDVPAALATEGNYITPEQAAALTATVNGNMSYPTTTRIPMSNVVVVTLDNSIHQAINLPVFRMLAKVEFTFKSLATAAIQVQKIVMNHVNQNGADNIFLLANLNGSNRPLVPATATSGSFDIDKTIDVGVGETTTPFSFYLNESKEPFPETIGFTLTTKRDGRASTDLRYALTQAYGLRRNDFLKIPVTLTDYIFSPIINFFPPIGGYAEATMTSDPNEVFYVTVNSGGQFVLHPRLYDDASETAIPDNELAITTSGDIDILSLPLSYNNTDGWWEATIDGTKTGRVLFELSYSIDLGGGTTVTMKRKIYLIKE